MRSFCQERRSAFVIFVRGFCSLYKCNAFSCLFESATNELYEKIEEYEGCGSGWVVDHLVSLEGNFNSF